MKQIGSTMTISFTPAVAEHIQKSLTKRGHGVGLRLSIKTSGCSGYSYVVDFADAVQTEDEVIDAYGAKVLVDKKNLALINGTVIDYERKGLNWELVFSNPKATYHCGCGESFSIDED